jgi:hypothetical protein
MVPIATGPIPVLIQFDSKSKRAKKPRQIKRFANGLNREAKEFYLEMMHQGRFPVVLAADLKPVFGPNSRYGEEDRQRWLAERRAEERLAEEGLLFDNTPPGLPD